MRGTALDGGRAWVHGLYARQYAITAQKKRNSGR